MSPGPDSTAPGPDVVTFGETMALLVGASPGPLRLAHTLELRTGGAESNTAIGLARLGHAVSWTGRVGADELGQRVLRDLQAEGVSTTHATTDEQYPTGIMIKSRRASGMTRVTYYRKNSAGSMLRPDHLDANLISSTRILHVSAITAALSRTAADAVAYAMGIAHDAGVLVSLDTNHRTALSTDAQARDMLRQLAEKADVLMANQAEAQLMTGLADPQAALHALTTISSGDVVIKLGEHGAVARVAEQVLTTPAVAVDVVDSVGAGDAFNAGYLSALLDGCSPEERLRRATIAGAFAVMNLGDWEGLPTRDELDILAPGSRHTGSHVVR